MNAEEKMATAPPPPGLVSAAEVAKVRDNYFTVVDGVAKFRCGSKYLYDDLTALLDAADKPDAPEPPTTEERAAWCNYMRATYSVYTPMEFATLLCTALTGKFDKRITAWLADSAPKGEGEKDGE